LEEECSEKVTIHKHIYGAKIIAHWWRMTVSMPSGITDFKSTSQQNKRACFASGLHHLSRPNDHCDEEPQNLREFVALKNNFIDVNVMEKGISAMADNPSGNFKALYEVVADKRTVEFSITEKPNAVNSSGKLSKDLVVFGPTEFFPEDVFGNKAEWITQGATSISLAPKNHKWTKWDLQQRSKLTTEQMQFSPNENYQVQINKSMFNQKETLKNAATATTHELYGHILFMLKGWDSSHGEHRETDNRRLENWIINRVDETDKNFSY